MRRACTAPERLRPEGLQRDPRGDRCARPRALRRLPHGRRPGPGARNLPASGWRGLRVWDGRSVAAARFAGGRRGERDGMRYAGACCRPRVHRAGRRADHSRSSLLPARDRRRPAADRPRARRGRRIRRHRPRPVGNPERARHRARPGGADHRRRCVAGGSSPVRSRPAAGRARTGDIVRPTSMSGDVLLAGVRVIDAASFIAGPVATTIMADLGADVIKIEPPDGDPYRHRTGGPGVAESPYNYRWIIDNRTKRGLALDLRQPGGRAVLHRLVERADVFVTNTPLESRARLGIRWADLAPLNRRLVYASMTAYGERGDEAPRTGFDATALWARTGLMDLVKPSPDSPPARSLPGMGDHPTGVSLFASTMTALYQRDRTGRGTMVSTSLLANGLWWNATQIQAALCGARVEPRPPREEPATALANLYRCADGRWFLLNVLNDDRDWPHLLKPIERPDLGTDPRFATTPARRANARALVPIFDQIFAARPWAEGPEDLFHHQLLLFGGGQGDHAPHHPPNNPPRAAGPPARPRAPPPP